MILQLLTVNKSCIKIKHGIFQATFNHCAECSENETCFPALSEKCKITGIVVKI